MNRFFLSVFFLLVIWPVAFAQVVKAENDIFEGYRERGIVVAQESGMAPMSYREVNGDPKGYIIDLWRKWSAETGVPVTFYLTEWANTLTVVRDGQADVHGGLFFTSERDKYLDFTNPIFPSKGGMFVKADSGITSVSELRGRPVGVIANSFYEDLINRKYPALKAVPMETVAELLEVFFCGEVDGFLADYPTLMFSVGALGKAKDVKTIEFFSHQNFRAAVAKGNVKLLGMIEEGLSRIDKDERDNIFNRWVVGDSNQIRQRLILAVIIGFTGLLVAALFPFFRSRRKS